MSTRTLARAQAIVAEYTSDPAARGVDSCDDDGHTSEDRLGCTLESHRKWMRSTPAKELRAWAEEWARS